MSNDAHIVYREWPAEVINEAVTEFNHQMHDDAGIEELSAGLHGLDFLTRRSTIDDDLQARLDGCITEANMRIELLHAKAAMDKSAEDQFKEVKRSVENLGRGIKAIQHLIRRGGGAEDYFFAKYGVPIGHDIEDDEDE